MNKKINAQINQENVSGVGKNLYLLIDHDTDEVYALTMHRADNLLHLKKQHFNNYIKDYCENRITPTNKRYFNNQWGVINIRKIGSIQKEKNEFKKTSNKN